MYTSREIIIIGGSRNLNAKSLGKVITRICIPQRLRNFLNFRKFTFRASLLPLLSRLSRFSGRNEPSIALAEPELSTLRRSRCANRGCRGAIKIKLNEERLRTLLSLWRRKIPSGREEKFCSNETTDLNINGAWSPMSRVICIIRRAAYAREP